MCPMCRLLLATPEGLHMVAALREGIAILLVAPFASFAIIAHFAVKSQRRFDADRAQEPRPEPPSNP